MSRHQSSRVVAKLLAEFTKVRRVSRLPESESFVSEDLTHDGAEVRHSSRLKYTRHESSKNEEPGKKERVQSTVIQIRDNKRNYRSGVRELLRPRVKDYNGAESSTGLLEEFRPRHSPPSEADFRPDGRDE